MMILVCLVPPYNFSQIILPIESIFITQMLLGLLAF